MTQSTFRILPAIDLLDGECVRLERGERESKTVYSNDPGAMARQWHDHGAKALHVVDLNGAFEGEQKNFKHLKAIRASFEGFIETGGGLRSEDAVARVLDAGIDCAILGTAALEDRDLLLALLEKFGPEKIAVAVDARDGHVAVRGWTATGRVMALDLLRELELRGVKRVIYTDISTDGTLQGPNLEAIKRAAHHAPTITIIASGGVGSLPDVQAIADLPQPNVQGVVIGKALYAGLIQLDEAIALERS